ncbi:MAG: dihydrofolate reductase [Rhodocyclaceae bacterium]|nr:dihydrofolate reductase [Rhodocyclaceae bacterium]
MDGTPELVVIAAVDRNGGIGIDGDLPWRLRNDLQRFRALTMGHPIIMGRKTWDSLGRPLPGRRSIVISRDRSLRPEGAERAGSLEEALALVRGAERAFVIGGAQIYALALPAAQRLLLTEVSATVAADAHFPHWPRDQFEEVTREHFSADDDNDHPFDFVEYRRVTPA